MHVHNVRSKCTKSTYVCTYLPVAYPEESHIQPTPGAERASATSRYPQYWLPPNDNKLINGWICGNEWVWE